jgi:hypothetical protein
VADFVTIREVGPSIDQLIDKMSRDLKGSMRTTAREVSKVGVKAFKGAAGVSSFGGYPLKFRAKKVTANPTHALVEFQASPVGYWVIVTWGAKPHEIRPRSKDGALAWGSAAYERVDHPGMSGNGAFTRGMTAAVAAMDEVIGDTVGEAIGAR